MGKPSLAHVSSLQTRNGNIAGGALSRRMLHGRQRAASGLPSLCPLCVTADMARQRHRPERTIVNDITLHFDLFKVFRMNGGSLRIEEIWPAGSLWPSYRCLYARSVLVKCQRETASSFLKYIILTAPYCQRPALKCLTWMFIVSVDKSYVDAVQIFCINHNLLSTIKSEQIERIIYNTS